MSSPLYRQEQAEFNNLSKYLLSEDQLDSSYASTSAKSNTAKHGHASENRNTSSATAGEFQHAGEDCSICTMNAATHFALPCRHSACKSCFSRWLVNSKLCMTCSTPIVNIQRYPTSVTPLTWYELMEQGGSDSARQRAASDHNFSVRTRLIDQSLDHCVRSILMVKDKLSKVASDCHTVESHLFNITRPDANSRVTVDTLTSVLAVEQSNVVEALRFYQSIFSPGREWDAMDQELKLLYQHIAAFAKLIDLAVQAPGGDKRLEGRVLAKADSKTALVGQVHQKGDELLDEINLDDDSDCQNTEQGGLAEEGQIQLSKSELKDAIETFEILVAQTSIVAQWNHLQSLLATVGPAQPLVPGVVRVLMLCGMINLNTPSDTENVDIAKLARATMESATQKGCKTDHLISSELLPEALLVLERLRSMQ